MRHRLFNSLLSHSFFLCYPTPNSGFKNASTKYCSAT
jgi:hypothetical protein